MSNSDAAPVAPIISVTGVSKWYGAFQVLTDVSLSVAKGEKVVICGPSGSGKSTLIRCLNGLEEFDSGSVSIDGLDLANPKTDVNAYRREVGMVFQHFNLFPHLDLVQNCVLAPMSVRGMSRRAAEAMAVKLLERVRLGEHAHKYPSQLSGGQQQRAAIARALCMEPRAMLFDEPTSALDPELVGEVLNVIRDLAAEGRTMILVTHEMKFAREVASHVIYLHNGLIEEEGPPDALFGAPRSDRLKQFLKSVG